MHQKSPSVTTDPKHRTKLKQIIDLVIWIITRAIFMPRLSNLLINSIIHFRLVLYLVTCFLRGRVSFLCRLQAELKINVPIYPYLIRERRRNCSTLWPAQQLNRDSHETCCHANMNTCENCWAYCSENLKIAALKLLLNQFASSNLSIYFNIVRCWGSIVILTFLTNPLVVN